MSKKTKSVEAKKSRAEGPRLGQPVYSLEKVKLGIVDAVMKTKSGKEWRLDNGTVITDPSQYIFGKSAIIKAVLG